MGDGIDHRRAPREGLPVAIVAAARRARVVPDLLGLREAHEHLVDHRVDAAAADRVVRRVLDHPAPCQAQERRRPGAGVDVECAERLGVALEQPLGATGSLLDVDPGARDAHEHVGARAGAHLAPPARGIGLQRPSPFEIARQRGDLEVRCIVDLVQAVDERREVGDRGGVIGPVHGQHRLVAEPRARPVDEADGGRLEAVRRREHARRVAVAVGKVLGADPRAVGRLPAKGVAVDRRRNAAPHDGIGQAGATQDLRHLRDVAEHVGQVAHLHRLAEVGRPRPAGLQVAHQGLARHQELVHQDLPWTDGQSS